MHLRGMPERHPRGAFIVPAEILAARCVWHVDHDRWVRCRRGTAAVGQPVAYCHRRRRRTSPAVAFLGWRRRLRIA
jgi:hypothetical protein